MNLTEYSMNIIHSLSTGPHKKSGCVSDSLEMAKESFRVMQLKKKIN